MSIIQILIERDNMPEEEAKELFILARKALYEYISEGDEEAAYNICEEFFGLEPDYIMELM